MTDTARDQIKLPADLLRDAVTGPHRPELAGPTASSANPSAGASANPSAKLTAEPAASPASPARPVPGKAATPRFLQALNGAPDIKRLRWPAAAAAGMLLTAGLGYGAAHLGGETDKPDLTDQRWHEATASLQQTHGEVARLAAELKSVRGALDGLKTDRSRSELGAKQAQLSDKLDKANADSTAKIVKLAEQLDRIEKNQRDPARFTPVVERLDRIEKQTLTVADKVAAPTPPPKPVAATTPAPVADPVQTGSIGEAKAAPKAPEFDPRKTQLDSHILRDIGDGVALLEARNGRVFEVRPGQNVAGLGKVETIERRGRGWIVVTSKGFIGEHLP